MALGHIAACTCADCMIEKLSPNPPRYDVTAIAETPVEPPSVPDVQEDVKLDAFGGIEEVEGMVLVGQGLIKGGTTHVLVFNAIGTSPGALHDVKEIAIYWERNQFTTGLGEWKCIPWHGNS